MQAGPVLDVSALYIRSHGIDSVFIRG